MCVTSELDQAASGFLWLVTPQHVGPGSICIGCMTYIYTTDHQATLPQGALEKKETNAHVHLQNPSKKHPPTSFFFFFFPRPIFLLHFQAFLNNWSSKTPPQKKVDVKMFYKK
jgi:hypothetical protein